MDEKKTQEVTHDVDDYGHCSHCGGTHYGTGRVCVDKQTFTPSPQRRSLRMDCYIGTKIVLAEPETKDEREGYAVVYEDGYRSWSPKETFERAYRRITPAEIGLIENPNPPQRAGSGS